MTTMRSSGKYQDVSVSSAEVVNIDGYVPELDTQVVIEKDVRQPLGLRFGHDAPRIRVCDHLGIERLHERIPARVILVQVRVDHVAHRLVRDLSEVLHDAVVVHREFVVDQQHAVA
jgi:hypothetical protein